MKKYIFAFIIAITAIFCIPTNIYSQNFKREGTTFVSTKTATVKSEPTKTRFTWKDSKGQEYPIYISSTGSCFIIKVSSKTNKEYRMYLNPELSQQICKELNIEYKSKTKS